MRRNAVLDQRDQTQMDQTCERSPGQGATQAELMKALDTHNNFQFSSNPIAAKSPVLWKIFSSVSLEKNDIQVGTLDTSSAHRMAD